MTEHYIEVPGGSLFAIDEGDPAAPPVLLLHAGIADLRSWDDMAPLLTAAGYRVVRFDARGFGRSTTESVEFTTHGDILALLDALGIERAAFVGNSRGGMMSFDTALEAPDRVVAIVGVAAGIGGFDGSKTPDEQALFAEMERLEAIEPLDADAVAEIDLRIWVDGPGQSTTRVAPALRALMRDMDFPADWATRPEPDVVRLDPPAVTRVAELRCPILLVVGGLDESGPAQVAAHLETAAVNAAEVSVVIIPDVAHMIGMEVPDTLAALVVDFLAPLPRWS